METTSITHLTQMVLISLVRFQVEDEILHDGDFLIGNAKYQKLNLVKGVTVERERKSKERIVEYTVTA